MHIPGIFEEGVLFIRAKTGVTVSVRLSLLAILQQGPCYGYQLRAEFNRRTGATSPLNVGQIYNTLDRLERDGFVTRGETDSQGHVYYVITPLGTTQVREWLSGTVSRPSGTRDELTLKLALAVTLPRVDAGALVAEQRTASVAALEALRHSAYEAAPEAPDGELFAWRLVTDALIFQAEAEVRWLEHIERQLAAHPARTFTIAPETDRPRRGRPPRTAEPVGTAMLG